MKAKLFGFLEHFFYYIVLISLILFLIFNYIEFIYLSIVCWFASGFSHVLESKFEGKKINRKTILGI